tara:strand:- start:1315 stop:1746 length:432 start_codon:yes stop_codon:yes gene_type:complete
MLLVASVLFALFSAVEIIIFHYWGLRTITQFSKRFSSHFMMSISVVVCLFLIHLIEIAWYSLMMYFAYEIWGVSGFQGDVSLSIDDYVHIAASSFTTLGSLTHTPHSELAVIIDSISLVGFMMLTWSATYYYNIFSNSELRDN